MENIYRAYMKCRRRKRRTVNAMLFEENLEENLVKLHEELSTGSYRPGRSLAFLVEKPKRREIFAADFRDRVVHHVLVGYLEPEWERRFIHDSYACRKERGIHSGAERLRTFTRRVTANSKKEAWYLQLDIKGFFINIDKNILYERIAGPVRDHAVLWLLRLLIFHDPRKNCLLKGAYRSDFERMPVHKTLFRAPPDCGLPIGNLTSQFFANVYLDALDQFVKHELRARYYIRYCDDFILLSGDRGELERWEARIREFIAHRLKLELNERRRLRRVYDGIDFLGYIVRPGYVLVRRRVVGSLRERLRGMEKTLCSLGMARYQCGRRVFVWHEDLISQMRDWLNSYFAHFRHACCCRLISSIWSRFEWLREYFVICEGKLTLKCPLPIRAMTYSRQAEHFACCLPGHVIIMQAGRFWQVHGAEMPEAFHDPECPGVMNRRFHDRYAGLMGRILWHSPYNAAWIEETGTRMGQVAQRMIRCRWEVREPGKTER